MFPVRTRRWTRKEYDRLIEVGVLHEHERVDRAARFGWRYQDVQTFREGASISPLARPDVTIAVSDLLP